ncbi:AzlD domain-containing protein [Streptomyces sp. ODS28]|uniref:branched-chain amino acid transporter permease n=1 Tax=Streptomyces sp. ODS28 TaxID=3136688 RepID=UPI0031E7F9BA
MPSTGYLLAAVGVAAAVTWGLRALPFAALAPLRESPVVHFLSTHMPAGVMVVLVVYSLHGAEFTKPPYGAPLGIALLVTVGLHLWRKNAVLSIMAGTAVNVLLASTVFAS